MKQIESLLFFEDAQGQPDSDLRDSARAAMVAETESRPWTITRNDLLTWNQATATAFGEDIGASTVGNPGFVLTSTYDGDENDLDGEGNPLWRADADAISEAGSNDANGCYACRASDI